MKIGDSILFALPEKYKDNMLLFQQRVSAMASTRAKAASENMKFSTRQEANGVRVWRTE